MALQPAKNVELATGYRLIERLGAGGYGEVWKATAPGGLTKAVKIVFGAMDGPQAEQELKALGRIKEVRHPFLLSLERIDVLDGQLFVVTELAEGSLLDRYLQCQRQGLPGIPRDELLSHLRDAADALDYMSQTHGLQHLDVKPQNLLLVGGRMKVADFGQVRYLGGVGNTAPGVTPVYATPEAFDGRVSRHSDQYSLAVVYQEMLTGARPFPGTTMMQLAAQHIGCQPSLASLPPGDRPAIGRALAKVPEHRFPSCLKMVDALLAARQIETLPQPGSARPATQVSTRLSITVEPTSEGATTNTEGPPEADALRETVIPEIGTPAAVVRRERFERPEGARPGIRPTLFLGIGGLAGAALRRLKKRLREKYGDTAKMPALGFLLLDTDRDDLRRGRQDDSAAVLDPAETLLTPLHPPEHYRQTSKNLLRWLDRRWLYGIPRSLLTSGLRPLGRLALVDNAPEVLARVREALARITNSESLVTTARTASSMVRDETPRVYVVASVTGGTGGGMLVSMAYGVRQVLGELGLPATGLCAFLLHATGPQLEDRETARVNTTATFNELEILDRPDVTYPGEPESGLMAAATGQAPFAERYVIRLGDGLDRDGAEAATAGVGDYLFFDALPDSGACFDLVRSQTRGGTGNGGSVRTFGLAKVDRGDRPDEQAARLLCRQLLERWLTEPDAEQTQALHRQAQREVVTRGLEERSLILSVQMAVNTATGNRPDAFIPQTLARAAAVAGSNRPAQMLGCIDAAFVKNSERTSDSTGVRSPLQVVVGITALSYGKEISSALISWLTGQIEQPGKRFKAAERAATFFTKTLATLSKSAIARTMRVRGQRVSLRQQIEAQAPAAGGISRAGAGAAPAELKTGRELDEYCRLWLREVAETSAVTLLGFVQAQIEAFLEEVSLCCRQLRAACDRYRPGSSSKQLQLLPRSGLTLPVAGAVQLAAPGSSVEDTLPAGLVQQFDRTFQASSFETMGWFRAGTAGADSPGGSAGNTSRPTLTPEQFADDLLARARETMQGAVKNADRASVFLRAQGGPERAATVLRVRAEAARPRLAVTEGQRHWIVALPEGPSGEAVNEILREAFSGTPGSLVHWNDGIVLCCEQSGCPLPAVARSLIGSEEVPADLVRTVMTRLLVPLPARGSGKTELFRG